MTRNWFKIKLKSDWSWTGWTWNWVELTRLKIYLVPSISLEVTCWHEPFKHLIVSIYSMSKRGHLQVAIGFRTLKIGVAVQVSVVPKQRWQSVRGMLERCSCAAVQLLCKVELRFCRFPRPWCEVQVTGWLLSIASSPEGPAQCQILALASQQYLPADLVT